MQSQFIVFCFDDLIIEISTVTSCKIQKQRKKILISIIGTTAIVVAAEIIQKKNSPKAKTARAWKRVKKKFVIHVKVWRNDLEQPLFYFIADRKASEAITAKEKEKNKRIQFVRYAFSFFFLHYSRPNESTQMIENYTLIPISCRK